MKLLMLDHIYIGYENLISHRTCKLLVRISQLVKIMFGLNFLFLNKESPPTVPNGFFL